MILLKKAVRSVWRGRRSYLACIALMALGVMLFVALNTLYVNLDNAMRVMYREQRFADGFVRLKEIPLSFLPRLEAFDGVEQVQGSLTADARVEGLSQTGEIITLRLCSFDPADSGRLNDFLLTQGKLPARDGELLLGEPFLNAHGLAPGDSLTLVLDGKKSAFTISGAVLSPEYAYAIPDSGQLMPDERAFGFAFLPYSALAGLTGKNGSANTLAIALAANAEFDSVKPLLEDALEPYGLHMLLPRKDQPSNAMLSQEVESLGSMASSISFVFIGMAVIILYIMLGRVIQQERISIGTLKAFGFSDRSLLLHYLSYGLAVGIPGGILGVVGGFAIADASTGIYLLYFHLPALNAPREPLYPVLGFAVALLSGALGAFMGARPMLRLAPGEAMRPPAPRKVTRDALKSLGPVRFLLAGSGRMAVRNISRSGFRSLFVTVGIAFSFALIAFLGSYDYMFDIMLVEQFSKIQVYGLKIALTEPRPHVQTLEAAWRLDGVEKAEAILELPAELRLNHLKKAATVTGLADGTELYRIYDSDTGNVSEPPREGLILSRSLADALGATRGSLLKITTAYTGSREFVVSVADIIESSLGMACFMELSSLCDLLELPALSNSVIVNTSQAGALRETLLESGSVAALTDAQSMKRIYESLMDTYAGMIYFMFLFGVATAFAIITNTASVSLSERNREYSTLRVLGMSPREIGGVLAFEYRVLSAAGILLGLPLTRALKEGLRKVMQTDLFSLPVKTPAASFLLAAVLCLATVELCNLLAVRSISRMDMVEVLKERD